MYRMLLVGGGLLLFVLVVALAAASMTKQQVVHYTSESGFYTVDPPVGLGYYESEQHTTYKIPGGVELKTTTWDLDDNTSYSISYFDFPADALTNLNLKAVYDDLANLNEPNNKIVKNDNLKMADLPARDVLIEHKSTPPTYSRMLLIFDKPRAYRILVSTTKSDECNNPKIDALFGSFKLLPRPAPKPTPSKSPQ